MITKCKFCWSHEKTPSDTRQMGFFFFTVPPLYHRRRDKWPADRTEGCNRLLWSRSRAILAQVAHISGAGGFLGGGPAPL